jgi:hypothetical protein
MDLLACAKKPCNYAPPQVGVVGPDPWRLRDKPPASTQYIIYVIVTDLDSLCLDHNLTNQSTAVCSRPLSR